MKGGEARFLCQGMSLSGCGHTVGSLRAKKKLSVIQENLISFSLKSLSPDLTGDRS